MNVLMVAALARGLVELWLIALLVAEAINLCWHMKVYMACMWAEGFDSNTEC